jgi:phosphoenolpyruvate carboxykinase (ATP)
MIPKSVKGIPSDILNPAKSWKGVESYDSTVKKLAGLFASHFEEYKDIAGPEVFKGAPVVK